MEDRALAEGDLVFAEDAHTWKSIRKLKQTRQASISNYLRSIDFDAKFVRATAARFPGAPVFANLRNGLWYGPPSLFQGSCYFKSTDGHVGNWAFSLSRLNLQIATAAAAHGCVVIVDSTRMGKSLPDSFNFTLPIWCAVLNTVMGLDPTLHCPTGTPPSHVDRIQRDIIPAAVSALGDTASLIRAAMDGITGPLTPSWICNSARETSDDVVVAPAGSDAAAGDARVRIICVSASVPRTDAELAALRESQSWSYIQGAGDDEENWACGLTPQMFWDNHDELVAAHPSDCDRIVLDIVACHAEASAPPAQVTTLHIRFGSGPVPILVTDRKRHQTVVYAQPPHVIDVCERPWVPPAALVPIAAVSVPVHTQKRVDPPDHWEENVLPVVLQCCWEWIEFTLANPDAVSPLVVVWDVDETVALTVVIALLCAFFDVGLTPLDWVVGTGPPLPVSKDTVKRMYAALQQRCPACPIVPRRLVKLLNSYYTDPVSSWHRWRICHLKT